MNSDASPPSFELPTPHPAGSSENTPSSNEKTAARPELSPIPSAPPTQPVLPPPPHPIFNQPGKSSTSPSRAAKSVTDDLHAEDSDLIEKEWVQKAKQIIAATKEDPHIQNREMGRIKADYLKKRYNKDIKLEEA